MKKYLDGLEKTITVTCVGLFFIICILIALQVFTRYVLGSSLSWSEQAARVSFVWMTLLYAGVLVRNGSNLGFDIVTNKLPKKLAFAAMLITDLGILAFALFWMVQGLVLCQSFIGFTLSGVNLPYNAVYASEPAGAFIIAIFSLEQFVLHIKKNRDEMRAAT